MSSPETSPARCRRGSSIGATSASTSTSACTRSSRRWSSVWAIVYRSARAVDRVALGEVRVEQALRRRAVDHLRELPAQVHRVLHPEAEPLSAGGIVDVGRVAGEQHAPGAVGRGLARRVGEAGDPDRAVDPEVGAVDPARARRCSSSSVGSRSARASGSVRTTRTARRPRAGRSPWTPTASWRSPSSGGPRSSRPRRSGCCASRPSPGSRCRPALRIRLRPPSHPTRYCARSVVAVGQRDLDAGVVLREARHLARRSGPCTGSSATQPARIRSISFCNSASVYGCRVGKSLMSSTVVPKRHDLHRLPSLEEPLRDPALVEHLDRARVQTAGARARRARDPGAARRPRRRPSPAPAPPPASSPPARPRRSPQHVQSSAHSRRLPCGGRLCGRNQCLMRHFVPV